MKIEDQESERIFGTEIEYNPIFVVRGEAGKETAWPSNAFELPLPEGVGRLGTFATNGARFYVCGIPEYSTPETRGVADVVHSEETADIFMINAAQRMAKAATDIGRVVLHKRTATDPFYESGASLPFGLATTIQSWGYHENYLARREHFQTELSLVILAAHLATRGLLVGSGYWRPTPSNPSRMLTSQKLLDIETDYKNATQDHKPLVNLRNEPHAGENYARWHVTSGDVNIAPWSTWMKLGSTSLVLRLAETGYGELIAEHLPEDPLAAAQAFAWQGPAAKLRLKDGNEVRAIDQQEILATACAELAELTQLPAEERVILRAWQQAIEDYGRDPKLLKNRTEWIARSLWIQDVQERLIRLGSSGDVLLRQLNAADKMWDKLMPVSDDPKKQGVAFRKRRGMAFPGYNPARAAELVHTPPPSTRAEERAAHIAERIRQGDTTTGFDWTGVKDASLPNPYGGNTDILARLAEDDSAEAEATADEIRDR